MQRRHFLRGAGLAAVALSSGALRANETGAARAGAPAVPAGAAIEGFAAAAAVRARAALVPIRASADRIIAINVCTRP